MKDPTRFRCLLQYPLKIEDPWGLKPLITKFLTSGLLQPTNSPYNTSPVLVKKADSPSCLVQDLHMINEAVIPLCPVVPNPYNLLSTLPSNTQAFTVLDLKDAFFTITLTRVSGHLCLYLDCSTRGTPNN